MDQLKTAIILKLETLHLFIFISIIVLPYFLPKKYLPYYILTIVLLFIQFYLIGGCIFTFLTNKLSDYPEITDPFIARIVQKATGTKLSIKTLDKGTDLAIGFSGLIAIVRYLF